MPTTLGHSTGAAEEDWWVWCRSRVNWRSLRTKIPCIIVECKKPEFWHKRHLTVVCLCNFSCIPFSPDLSTFFWRSRRRTQRTSSCSRSSPATCARPPHSLSAKRLAARQTAKRWTLRRSGGSEQVGWPALSSSGSSPPRASSWEQPLVVSARPRGTW